VTEVVAGVLLLVGSAFVLISAIGVIRLPDVYMRLHAATKAGTLGAGIVLAGAAVLFGALGVTVKALVVFVFLLLTAPVAAHVLGRASYYDGTEKWSRTELDELAGRYDGAVGAGSVGPAREADAPKAPSQT
jgi:multicomponent Na+:H+ antiporter subunit G